MRISADDGTSLLTLDLVANKYARATIAPKLRSTVSVVFSDSVIDPTGRKLSFYITSTNFFAETDL